MAIQDVRGNSQKFDVSQDVGYVYTTMIGYHPNALTLVVVSHFLVEYLLNRIISKKCRNPAKILKYTFSIKLDLLNAMKLLPEDVYNNIIILNKLRNAIVHTLETNIGDMIFYKPQGAKFIIKKFKSGEIERNYLKLLSHGIFISLRNYMLVSLKISPLIEL